jgi:Ion channel
MPSALIEVEMQIAVFITGVVLIIIVLLDAFETVVFPRRVTRRVRLVRYFYRTTWSFWSLLVRTFATGRRQETYLSYFGPVSLPLLLGFWAAVLIFGFAFLYWTPGHAIKTPEGVVTFGACLYFSGTTFFTLGLGDIVPNAALTRALVVFETGIGFGFLAMVISYLPAINQSFSRREVNISLLDARAGSPPTALEILRRHTRNHAGNALTQFLHEWERWSAELLESHLSFPVLVYFRSQHDNQSWLAALTAILDTCAYAMTHLEGEGVRQAELTFAMTRHAIIDLALILHVSPKKPKGDRLPPDDAVVLRSTLVAGGIQLRENADAAQQLTELRRSYEPFVAALSNRLHLSIPPWMLASTMSDNWQVSAWGKSSSLDRPGRTRKPEKDHF